MAPLDVKMVAYLNLLHAARGLFDLSRDVDLLVCKPGQAFALLEFIEDVDLLQVCSTMLG